MTHGHGPLVETRLFIGLVEELFGDGDDVVNKHVSRLASYYKNKGLTQVPHGSDGRFYCNCADVCLVSRM